MNAIYQPPTSALAERDKTEKRALGRYVTIKECAAVRPFSSAALRDLKFKAHDRKSSRGHLIKGNGTGRAGVWVQIGAKILIDLDAFDCWIESHRLRGK